jgi:ferredoxin
MSLFVIDKDKCRRDGCCTEECPLGLIEIKGEGAFPSSVEGANELCIDSAIVSRSVRPVRCHRT